MDQLSFTKYFEDFQIPQAVKFVQVRKIPHLTQMEIPVL